MIKYLYTAKEDDVIVSYKENNGYIYCEENNNGKNRMDKKK